MNFSLTYSGAAVMVLGFIFQAAGINFAPEQAQGAINFIVEAIGVVMTLVGRYRVGGINVFGVKK